MILNNKKQNCPVPNCPTEDKEPQMPDPNCQCGKPLMIVIPAGQHIHPCHVHPDVIIYG